MVNPRYAQDVVKFYSTLEATSRKGFEVVSKINEKFIKEAFVVEVHDVLEECLHAFFE